MQRTAASMPKYVWNGHCSSELKGYSVMRVKLLTSLGAMKAKVLWMTPAAMAGADKVPPHSHRHCRKPLS